MKKSEHDTSTVGGRLKKLRADSGMTQADLVECLYLANKTTISKYESNQRMPGSDHIVLLAQALNTTTDYILTGKGHEETVMSEEMAEAQKVLHLIETAGLLGAAIIILKTLLETKQNRK